MKINITIDVHPDHLHLPVDEILDGYVAKLRKKKKENPITNDDFEAIWAKYPRKVNKKSAKDKFIKKIQSTKKLEQINLAVDLYSRYVLENDMDEKFIKHFSTFLNSWEDWLPKNLDSTPISDEQGLVLR